MSYKVDFGSLDSMYNSVGNQSNTWVSELNAIKGKFQTLIETSKMSGVAADNIKNYIENVHMTLIGLLSQLVSLHSSNCLLYKSDYQTTIDTDLHAVIKSTELLNYKRRIDATKSTAVSIDDSLSYVLSGIRDIFRVSYSDVSAVDSEHTSVATFLSELDEKIKTLENTHYNNDFVNTTEMINNLKAFINELKSSSRTYRTNFTTDSLASSATYLQLYNSHVDVTKEFSEKSKAIETAVEFEKKHLEEVQQAEEDSRKWIQWVAVGVAIVGSVVLIAVTAGGATPLVCAAVGAGAGVTTAAAQGFANNYVENGSLTEGMDWSEFGKDCLIGGVTGAISGGLGATSVGSVIKQPIDKAIGSVAKSVVTNGVEGLIETTWDVGEAIIQGKPGDEILSVLEEDIGNMMENLVTDGLTDFVTGYVGGHFDVDSSKKSFLRNVGEGVIEGTAESFTKNATESIWDVGEALIDPNSSKNFSTILQEEGKEFASSFAGDFVEDTVGAIIGGANDSYKNHRSSSKEGNPFFEISNDVLFDTVSEAAGSFVGGIAEQQVEIKTGDRKELDFEEIWKEDMAGGQKIVRKAVESAGKGISDEVLEEKSVLNKLKDKDYDGDGKVDVIVFDKYTVLKEDYEAAREVAGKGAYKDQSAQDILGLPKNARISEKNMIQKRVSIEDLEKSNYKARKTTNVSKYDFKK